MRSIAQILRYLTRPTSERIVNALITSRLDYCNSLLFGTSASNINRLQRLQNSVARLVTRQARRDSAMPLLCELHWLPVRHRVTYKIAELTFKALHVDLSPILPTYSSACRFTNLPGLFAPRAATPLFRTDPALLLGTALLCTLPLRFGMRYLSP